MTMNAQKTQLNFTFIGSSTYATEHFKDFFVFKQIIKIKKIKKSQKSKQKWPRAYH